MSAFQECHDYCGTSPGSTCSCSLVNSVVYQKMMTIAGVLVVLVVLMIMKLMLCRTTVRLPPAPRAGPVLHHVLLFTRLCPSLAGRSGPLCVPGPQSVPGRTVRAVCRTLPSQQQHHCSAASI